MILLSLLLAAAPPVLLEPDAGSAHRLHPRRVTASSFLANGWNKHEQNYLPLYVADEDPTTAWVEGVKGRGEGESLEWWGPALTKAKAYRLFVRNGFQKTDKLFRANARPRKVKLEPLVQGETGPQTTGTPLEVELKDVRGWQEVRLPVPAKVAGVRLTLVTTYPGSAYEDTCLSDLRVYVEGDDPYRPEAEAAAFEVVRAFALERKQAAARKDTGAKLAWAPRYTAETLLSQERDTKKAAGLGGVWTGLDSVPEQESYRAALALARNAEALFSSVDLELNGSGSLARTHWTRVTYSERQSQGAAAMTALSAMEDDGVRDVAGLLHLGNVSFTEDKTTQAEQAAREAEREKYELAQRTCVNTCEKTRKKKPLPAGESYDCDCKDECADNCGGPPLYSAEELDRRYGGGEFLQGSLEEPTAYLFGVAQQTGNREVWVRFRQTLVTYAGDKAEVVLRQVEDAPLQVHVLDWKESKGKASIASITSFIVSSESIRVLRYRPAT
ncbi:NADase-type glycan-binding domain-containing protein [Corallococcus terminator]|uniref:NAD glycohydrolase translocation F5/8 type C domain-containing protein n=1 Tax=Corallococcus terminator TaxID=2316733 RepID=A0A3A8IJ92_9BACT|nr:hypothetical protein [Corallococcus terminator]RKG83519.1 hypothetical protein D7V88_23945 [Corallococcus terminator]